MALTVGSQARLQYNVTNSSGVLVNPVGATLQITLPDLTTFSPTITLPPAQTGILIYDYTTTMVGHHSALWSTSGPGSTDTTAFNIEPGYSPALFSLREAKQYLNESLTDTTNDYEIKAMVSVVTEIVERIVGNVLPKTYTEKCDSGYTLALTRGPIQSLTSVTPWMPGVGAETVAVSAVTIDYDGWTLHRNIGFYRGPYKITYVAGRQIIPASIIQGAKEILDHLWQSQRGSSVVGPGFGTSLEQLQVFNVRARTYTVPRAVVETLQGEATGPIMGG